MKKILLSISLITGLSIFNFAQSINDSIIANYGIEVFSEFETLIINSVENNNILALSERFVHTLSYDEDNIKKMHTSFQNTLPKEKQISYERLKKKMTSSFSMVDNKKNQNSFIEDYYKNKPNNLDNIKFKSGLIVKYATENSDNEFNRAEWKKLGLYPLMKNAAFICKYKNDNNETAEFIIAFDELFLFKGKIYFKNARCTVQ